MWTFCWSNDGRLAVQFYEGKPYGLGIWNTPFLRDLYPDEEQKRLVEFKKKVDPKEF